MRKWRVIVESRHVPAGLISALFCPTEQDIEPQLRRGDIYVTVGLNSEANIFPGLNAVKKRTGIGVMGMCYDLIPAKFPHFVESSQLKLFTRFTADMALCADKILCISKNTRHDLEQFLSTMKIPCPDVEVIRLGADIGIRKGPISPQVRVIRRAPYIIFVSNIEPRKNHEILYRAYEKLLEDGRTNIPNLILVGRGADSLHAQARLGRPIREVILVLSHVTDAELSYLYRHALFTVYPSLYEGWGLPVAESLAYGKFCIASSASSLPEVGGRFV
ncbi:MAG: glycosyltransferase family 4 protein, partial [Candidatus Dadabacteria bacterium]|nr:glycosyltransferase family 4 protein [Candidatus Dadabacteria bacterium]